MPLVNLKTLLRESVEKKYAVGAFPGMDFSITEQILETAERANRPVMFLLYGPYVFGKKNNDRRFFDIMWKMLDSATVPTTMILDHGTYEECFKAVELGFPSIMFDGSSLPLEENIRKTNELLKVCRAKNISVEAEVGHVGGNEGTTEDGSAITDLFTKPEEARYFVEATGVDALAVAIGSVHGVYRKEPELDIKRLDEIRQAVGNVPLVMHGGSGIPDPMMRRAVDHGINKINFATGLLLSATDAMHKDEADNPGKRRMYWDLMRAANKAIDAEVAHQIKVFNTQELK